MAFNKNIKHETADTFSCFHNPKSVMLAVLLGAVVQVPVSPPIVTVNRVSYEENGTNQTVNFNQSVSEMDFIQALTLMHDQLVQSQNSLDDDALSILYSNREKLYI